MIIILVQNKQSICLRKGRREAGLEVDAPEPVQADSVVSYADCFATATALKYNGVIVTGDPEFEKIEHKVDIDWI